MLVKYMYTRVQTHEKEPHEAKLVSPPRAIPFAFFQFLFALPSPGLVAEHLFHQ